MAMKLNKLSGIAAAAVASGVLAIQGSPRVGDGTECTFRAAKRYQAQQLAVTDVTLADKSAPQSLQSEAVARRVQDSTFKAALQDARFAETFGRSLNSPIVDGAAIAAPVSTELHVAE